jgi:hypothetical protein
MFVTHCLYTHCAHDIAEPVATLFVFFKRGSVPSRCTLGSAVFPEFFPKKRLELKSLKGRTKAEELGDPVLHLKPPYKFKKSYTAVIVIRIGSAENVDPGQNTATEARNAKC